MSEYQNVQEAFEGFKSKWIKLLTNNPPKKTSQEQVMVDFFNQVRPFLKELLESYQTLGKLLAQKGLIDSDEVVGPQNVQNVTFSSFLKKMGKAVLDAQEDLDNRSMSYLEKNREAAHVVPSVFRIPKVSASIKFGMKELYEDGFNIFLAKGSNTEESSLDQSLEFDIQAVPPPPDIYKLLENSLPKMSFILDKALRRELKQTIQLYEPDAEQKYLNTKALLDNWPVVLIMRTEVQGAPLYLLLLVEEHNPKIKKALGLWSLSGTPARLHSILRSDLTAGKEERYELLADWVLEWSQKQQSLI